MSSSTSTPILHLYRSILREVRLASKKPRRIRNPIIVTNLREIVTSSSEQDTLGRTLLETRDFMRSTRIHAELLKRYNPTADMTEEERIRATARRVGLDVPVPYPKD